MSSNYEHRYTIDQIHVLQSSYLWTDSTEGRAVAAQEVHVLILEPVNKLHSMAKWQNMAIKL